MLTSVRLVLGCTLLGALTGLAAGPLVGTFVASVFMLLYIGYVDGRGLILFGAVMTVQGPIIGALAGAITGITKRMVAAPIIGFLVGVVGEYLALWLSDGNPPTSLITVLWYLVMAAITGAITGIVLKWRFLHGRPDIIEARAHK